MHPTFLTLVALTALLLPCLQSHGQTSPSDDFPGDPLAKGTGIEVDTVWSGHPVGFALLTTRNVQIAAYYNSTRNIVIAARDLDAPAVTWHRQVLASQVGWDSHNYLTLQVDAQGHLHLSGNLHRNPMNYYRSAQPVTAAAQFSAAQPFMQKLPVLVNASNEAQSTYPAFITGPQEEFIFSYRNHTSDTAGSWYLLKYNPASQAFTQTSLAPVFSWTGNYSVYPVFKVSGGQLHCLFVWRGSPDAATNYRLSYMRTSDLVNWKDAFGRALTLPVTPGTTLTTIDDVPQQGGLLNGQPQLAFDRDGQPLVAYHKYGTSGYSQVYAARPSTTTANTWKITQLTSSTWHWNFSGGGSLPPGGSVSSTFGADDPLDGLATVSVTMTHEDGTADPANGPCVLDETTLTRVITALPNPNTYLSANTPSSSSGYVDSGTLENPYTHNGTPMGVRRTRSTGLTHADQHYYLRWETLPANRDLPRYDGSGNPIQPPPSSLKLYRTHCEFGAPVLNSGGHMTGLAFKPATATLAGSMALTPDARRPFGSHLSSPVTGTSSYAEWNFSVYYDGDYALGGSTSSLSGTDDSFYIQIDNGPLVDWHCTGRWSFLPVTITPSRGMTRFGLTPGSHRLRLYAREAGARLDHLWLNLPSSMKGPSLWPVSHQGFTLTSDSGAVSGYTLKSAAGSSQTGNSARYEIPVTQTGNHLLLGRTRAQDGTSDSFYLSINSTAPQAWHLPQSGPAWTWRAATATPLSLTASQTLTLDVTGREGGSELDSFILLKVP